MASQVEYITAFATVVGCIEALRQVQQKARRQEHRTRKNNLVVHCTRSSRFSPTLEGRHVVLSGDKLYVDTGTEWEFPSGHPACCFYHPFPGTQFEGLVTTICDDPPVLNWVYVDRETYEVKFGTKPWAEKNFKGPFDATRQDRRLTLGGWEGFVAVQEGNFWAVYFDALDDRLASKVPKGTPVLEIELRRVEMRVSKPVIPDEQPQWKGPGTAGRQEEEEGRGDCPPAVRLEAPEVD